jgi:aminopeptidase N
MWGLLLMAALGGAPGAGIPESLAQERARVIQSLRYELEFRLPESRQEPITAREVVRFTLSAPHRVVLDFAQPPDRLRGLTRDGRRVPFTFADNHVTIAASETVTGENAFVIEFVAGDDSLNRSDDFLYTLFVPARAHLAFPCFDQPDLKARYTLTLDVPAAWKAVANGPEVDRREAGVRTTVRFAPTSPLPTYLFAFAAGNFSVESAERRGRTFRMFHRETDAAKVARNRDAIFDLHASALAWLEEYTGIPYPWGKFDFILIPSFQFGGMEHAGAILYNASSQLLEESATQNQFLGRASLIAHETTHMWFGDLVTMRWFNDVWMKEVFANFMAAKIVNPSFPEVNHDLRFLLAHYPQAYEIDRTAGANPIRQQLTNLSDAGSLYGAIIYQKAPIVMRQLEVIVGETAFRDGLREYLNKYAFGNATWLDLIRILDARTRENLAAWSRAWVEERARPEMETDLQVNARGRISRLRLTVRDPLRRGLVWPQRLQVALGYPDGARTLSVYANAAIVTVPKAVGMDRPLYVLPNGAGLGYGLFVLDDESRRFLLEHIEDIPDALTRGSAWVTLWDNMLETRVTPQELLNAAVRALPKEIDEQNTQLVLEYVARAFWKYLPPDERLARVPGIETLLGQGLAAARTTSQKSAWFATFRDVALTREGLRRLERVWRRQEQVPGLSFAEVDEINMAMELAVREVPGWGEILDAQYARIENPDRKARFKFVMPSLSADAAVREASFDRFKTAENRQREPWVLEAQRYLNHPLREVHARRFVQPSLELLAEIKRTGDIFFPKRWMDATLAGHRSADAVTIVNDFLAGEVQYPSRLRWVVLTSADELFRAARLTTRAAIP